jgi:DNA-binding GntR family transcriptional regulator
MAARERGSAAPPPGELTELRLLIQLPAVRKLADRGLSDEELALVRKLADATMRPARRGDVSGFLQADMTFHLCLLELSADPAVGDVARLVLAPGPVGAPHAGRSGHPLTREAREHRELADMLAEGLVSAADELLRLHLSGCRSAVRRPREGMTWSAG